MRLITIYHAWTRVIPLRVPKEYLPANLLACMIVRPNMQKNVRVLAWIEAAVLVWISHTCPLTKICTSQDNAAHVYRWSDTALPNASYASWRWTLRYPTIQLRYNDAVAHVHMCCSPSALQLFRRFLTMSSKCPDAAALMPWCCCTVTMTLPRNSPHAALGMPQRLRPEDPLKLGRDHNYAAQLL
jgi:hypothetical protein